MENKFLRRVESAFPLHPGPNGLQLVVAPPRKLDLVPLPRRPWPTLTPVGSALTECLNLI